MGSYNHRCALSNAPIRPNDEVYLQTILVKIQCSDEWPAQFDVCYLRDAIEFVGPLIHATYEDYGEYNITEPLMESEMLYVARKTLRPFLNVDDYASMKAMNSQEFITSELNQLYKDRRYGKQQQFMAPLRFKKEVIDSLMNNHYRNGYAVRDDKGQYLRYAYRNADEQIAIFVEMFNSYIMQLASMQEDPVQWFELDREVSFALNSFTLQDRISIAEISQSHLTSEEVALVIERYAFSACVHHMLEEAGKIPMPTLVGDQEYELERSISMLKAMHDALEEVANKETSEL